MNKKTIRPLLLAGGLLLIGCAAVVGLVYLPTLVTPQVVPTPRAVPVNLGELLLDVSVMPPNTIVAQGPYTMSRDVDLDSEDNLEIFFDLPAHRGGSSSHFLYKFSDSVRAQSQYRGARAFAFLHDINDWRVPEGWTYTSPLADQFMFLCGTDDFFDVTRCSALARYDEVISDFSTPLVPGVMTLEDVERILREIDDRMAKHLK